MHGYFKARALAAFVALLVLTGQARAEYLEISRDPDDSL